MIHVGVELKFLQVLNVLEASVIELGRNKQKLNEPEPKDGCDHPIPVRIFYKIKFIYKLTKQYTVDSSPNSFVSGRNRIKPHDHPVHLDNTDEINDVERERLRGGGRKESAPLGSQIMRASDDAKRRSNPAAPRGQCRNTC